MDFKRLARVKNLRVGVEVLGSKQEKIEWKKNTKTVKNGNLDHIVKNPVVFVSRFYWIFLFLLLSTGHVLINHVCKYT